jgi:hypothetical protein
MPGESEHIPPITIIDKQCCNGGLVAFDKRRLEGAKPGRDTRVQIAVVTHRKACFVSDVHSVCPRCEVSARVDRTEVSVAELSISLSLADKWLRFSNGTVTQESGARR